MSDDEFHLLTNGLVSMTNDVGPRVATFDSRLLYVENTPAEQIRLKYTNVLQRCLELADDNPYTRFKVLSLYKRYPLKVIITYIGYGQFRVFYNDNATHAHVVGTGNTFCLVEHDNINLTCDDSTNFDLDEHNPSFGCLFDKRTKKLKLYNNPEFEETLKSLPVGTSVELPIKDVFPPDFYSRASLETDVEHDCFANRYMGHFTVDWTCDEHEAERDPWLANAYLNTFISNVVKFFEILNVGDVALINGQERTAAAMQIGYIVQNPFASEDDVKHWFQTSHADPGQGLEEFESLNLFRRTKDILQRQRTATTLLEFPPGQYVPPFSFVDACLL